MPESLRGDRWHRNKRQRGHLKDCAAQNDESNEQRASHENHPGVEMFERSPSVAPLSGIFNGKPKEIFAYTP